MNAQQNLAIPGCTVTPCICAICADFGIATLYVQVAHETIRARAEFADSDDDRSLAADIAARGVTQPIFGYFDHDGTFEVIDGRRRVQANVAAGRTTIPARALSRIPTPSELTLLTMATAAQRLNPCPEAAPPVLDFPYRIVSPSRSK